MKNLELYHKLKEQSTWRLFFLSAITLGIYVGYYIKRQSQKINGFLEKEDKISETFTNAILFILYFSLILFFVNTMYLLSIQDTYTYELEAPVIGIQILLELIENLVGLASNIMIIVWAFMMRNRMNSLNQYKPDHQEWFHGLWTFLFAALYFNYKINKESKTN